MLHETRSPLAGKTVKIKKDAFHPQNPTFGGSDILIEDWWDRIAGKSWTICDGNIGAMIYGLRAGMKGIRPDDEVLYGKIRGLGYLVHMSEIEHSL